MWIGRKTGRRIYWTSSGPYDEIYYYVKNDIDRMKEEIALLMSGTPVLANVREYASTSMELRTRDEIYSAMVVYGFLTWKNGYVSIPNKELMDKFEMNFEGRLGEMQRCTGRILAVGIAYNRKDENKRHECRVEVLREKE